MRRIAIITGLLVFIFTVLTGCGSGGKKQDGQEQVNLTVSAGASLKDALEELKEAYMQKHSNITISYNFGSSGSLQKQIEQGAPVDLFVSASKSQMDILADKGLIIDESRKDLLGNELLLISGKDSSLTALSDLTGDSVAKISIGTPETVPAGNYAKEALVNLELWNKIESKLVPAKDVRQVLTYVESGNVDAGFVYRSDAIVGKNINIVAVVPEDSHSPIVFPMAVIKDSKHGQEAREFAAFLQSDEAAGVFEKHGFKPLIK
ncbi:molybdate ABC transporter substrate-binding protein [Desulfolucanica intricata]|uniref:molybdate ABC transporter substrate-binding protein n=1 Tax=Desulfolucanica intricata TaxID=1285191 RepID=UPI000831AD79|nr:molybdate ABC transporter substrate-binding protein [Desulfolucanica intricata]